MSIKPYAYMLIKLIKTTIALSITLECTLLSAQLIKFMKVGSISLNDLWQFDAMSGLVPCLLYWGTPIMWEATAPLLALTATAVSYHQLRLEGFDLALRSMGARPIFMTLPAFLISIFLCISACYSAHQITPIALQKIASELQDSLSEKLKYDLAHAQGAWWNNQGSIDSEFIKIAEEIKSVRDPNHGVIWVWSPSSDTMIKTENIDYLPSSFEGEQDLKIVLKPVVIWSPFAQLRLDQIVLKVKNNPLQKALKTFTGPNQIPSDHLGSSAHERFTFHKRTALPISTIAWSIIGILLGLLGRAQWASVLGACLVGGSYTLLRYLELRARFDGGDPMLAAWLPTLLLYLIGGTGLVYWLHRGGHWRF